MLEHRFNCEIELMLDPLEFENAYKRPMSFDLLDEDRNVPDDIPRSSSIRVR